jgi:predicted pyridoxine 5'-phosphate oxidase superfamily flavin-nucleotide-binding protein
MLHKPNAFSLSTDCGKAIPSYSNLKTGEFPVAKMNQRMKEIFEKQRTIVLATATEDGIPNVVPVGMKKIVDDETILISDQYFNKTLKNIKDNPRAAITMWDKSEGYQIKGTVSMETSGRRFEETARWVEERGRSINKPLRSKGALILKITEIYCVSPGPDAGMRVA